MSEVSIIVPVYKVEKYIRQCIDSILEQTFSSFELILVNDGSPDKCGEICDEYAELDSRVKVIHKENGGLMNAWITGVLASKSPYIGFVDSDDWIEPKMYEILYNSMKDTDAEVVTCGMFENTINNEIPIGRKETEIFVGDEIREILIPQLLTNWSTVNPRLQNGRCDKLIKRELIIDNIKYCETDISTGEDLNIVFSVLLDARKVVCLGNSFLYHYRKGIESIINNYNPNLFTNNIKLISALKKIASIKGFTERSLELNTYYAYYQVICSECLSDRSLKEKMRSVKSIMSKLPNTLIFSELSKQFSLGGNYSRNRKLSLFLLSNNKWRFWLIGTHLMRKGKK